MIKKMEWCEFVRRVADRPNAHSPWGDSSVYVRGSGWAGTKDFPDMMELLEKGWPEGTGRIQTELAALSFQTAHQRDEGTGWNMDVAGAFPCVASYLAGDFEYMHAPDVDSQRAPTRRVFVDGTHPSRLDPHQVENFGLAVLAMVDAWEQAGESIELVWHYTAQNIKPVSRVSSKYKLAGGWHSLQVTLKRAGEHFDMDRLSFVLAHPSMLRRAAFAVAEQIPNFSTWVHLYGNSFPLPQEAREAGSVYLPRSMDVEDELYSPASALAALQSCAEL
jgi:hypothetical protein